MFQLTAAALTIILGVFVFVTGQILLRFVVEPVQEQRKTLGEIRATPCS